MKPERMRVLPTSSVPGSNASDYNSRRYMFFHSIQNYKLEIIIVLCLRWLLAAGGILLSGFPCQRECVRDYTKGVYCKKFSIKPLLGIFTKITTPVQLETKIN